MGEIIYDKLVYGRELTPEQWSKLKYRPLDDTDMYSIAENPSFGIDKSLIGGGNYMEIFYHHGNLGDINILCALFNIEAEHEEHQYLVEYDYPEQVYENTDEAQIPYRFVGPNYTGQDTPTATLGVDDWNDLISGRAVQFGYTKTGEEEQKLTIQDGSKTYDIGYAVGSDYYEFHVDTDNTELINALNTNGLYITGTDFTLNNLSVTRPATFDTADFTKISLSKIAPSIFESVFPENFYLYIKEPFSIDNGENAYIIYSNPKEDYLESFNTLGKFYTSLQTYSTPNVEVPPDYIGMGTVSVSPQKSSYEALSEITMTATPNEGYMFNKWSVGDGPIEENPHTDRVGPNYYAVFGRPVTITVEAEPIEGGTVSGGGTYAEYSNVTLTATPNEGYIFDGWWEGEDQRASSNDSEWHIQLPSEDTTYTAKFSSLEDRRLTYTTNSDAGEISWIVDNCIDGTYSHDANSGQAILRNDVSTIYGFGGNEKLASINIPQQITSIDYDAFNGCSGLKEVDLPNSLTKIENSAFKKCTGLTSIELPSSLTEINDSTFEDCFSLTSIKLPSSLTSIGYDAFKNCSSLTFIDLPDGLTSIGEAAFSSCASLTSIKLPSSLTSIGYDAFKNCSSLTFIDLPDGLTSIGDYAFENCIGLTSIKLPSGLISLGDPAFANCASLADVYCYIESVDIISSIGAKAYSIFYNIAENPTLHVPSSVLSEYQKQEYTYYHVFGENIIAITE